VKAFHRLVLRLVLLSLLLEARAAACLHDGRNGSCYGCAMMIGYGGFLPQATLDQILG
jgi:hypothetical protein